MHHRPQTRYRSTLLALMLLPGAAFGQSPEDIARITELAGQFATVTENSDMAGSLEMLPPTLIDSISAQMNVTRDEYIGHMIQAASQNASLVSVRSVTLDTDAMTWHEATDGSSYALIPTQSVVEISDTPGGPRSTVVQEVSQTLALKDRGEWHLVRLGSDQQQDNIRMAFPALYDQDFPLPQIEEVTQ